MLPSNCSGIAECVLSGTMGSVHISFARNEETRPFGLVSSFLAEEVGFDQASFRNLLNISNIQLNSRIINPLSVSGCFPLFCYEPVVFAFDGHGLGTEIFSISIRLIYAFICTPN